MSRWSRWQWMRVRSWASIAMSVVLLHCPSSGWRTGGKWSPAETPESNSLVGQPVWRSAQSQSQMQGITSARPATLPALTSASPGWLWKVLGFHLAELPVPCLSSCFLFYTFYAIELEILNHWGQIGCFSTQMGHIFYDCVGTSSFGSLLFAYWKKVFGQFTSAQTSESVFILVCPKYWDILQGVFFFIFVTALNSGEKTL